MIGMTGMTAAAPWTEVWGARELLRSLAVRNLKVKYQRSTLGFAWTLINPLLTLTVLAAVFTHVVKIAVPHYWAFLLSGYFVWNYLLQMISTATYVLAEHAGLRRSVAFPSEVLVLSAAASRLAEFAGEMALVVAALAVCHHSGVPASFSLLPLLVLLLILLSLGLVLPLAVLAAFYNDVQHAVPILLMMLFYASPVFYPVPLVPPDRLRAPPHGIHDGRGVAEHSPPALLPEPDRRPADALSSGALRRTLPAARPARRGRRRLGAPLPHRLCHLQSLQDGSRRDPLAPRWLEMSLPLLRRCSAAAWSRGSSATSTAPRRCGRSSSAPSCAGRSTSGAPSSSWTASICAWIPGKGWP